MLLMKVSVIFGKKLTFGALPRDFQVEIIINATGPSQSSNSNSGIEKFPSGKYFGVYVFFFTTTVTEIPPESFKPTFRTTHLCRNY